MYIFLTVLIVIAAILLTLLVLVQNSKGGGLAAGFNSGNQVMGVRKTTDFLEKATWSLIAVIAVLSVIAVWVAKGGKTVDSNQSAITEQVQQAAEQEAPMQAFPAEAEE